eukprot:5033907-Pyramimonas_sp.AAC.1
MLEDLSEFAVAFGLKIHAGKTKPMSNVQQRRSVLRQRRVQVGEGQAEVLSISDSTSHLGRQVTFGDYHDTEITHRRSTGWAGFGRFKSELCNKHYLLRSRFRLFNAVIASAVLCGCGSRTPTAERSDTLNVAMRKMLRKIVAVGRAPDEFCVDWIVRATHRAEPA